MLAALKLFETLDYTIIGLFLVVLFIAASYTKRLNRSTADFISANRTAGRYMLVMATAMAYMGAATMVINWQKQYTSGIGARWWGLILVPAGLVIAVSGWLNYRYRETRAMTLGQFLEMRYGRRFRLFGSFVSFTSGIMNFGILPAIGGKFFVSFCDMPQYISFTSIIPWLSAESWLAMWSIPSVPLVTVILVAISVYFTLQGGQITVLVTDFIQSFFMYIVVAITLFIMLQKFSIVEVFTALETSEAGMSLLDPRNAGKVEFNWTFALVPLWGMLYSRLSFQGFSAYQTSARSPHEAKMSGIIATLRFWAVDQGLLFIPLVAIMIMSSPQFADQAAEVNQQLAKLGGEGMNARQLDQMRSQVLVPMTMKLYLPVGLMGAFAAVVLAAFISTNDTMLHSWGTILVQDVIMPFRKKPFSPKQHMWILRLSVLGVAIYAILFSCLYKENDFVPYFLAITGSIWMAGAGSCIIGGLYTRWGTTLAAYSTVIVGAIIGIAGVILTTYWPDWYDGDRFPMKGHIYGFYSALIAVATYLIVSLVPRLMGYKTNFNLEKMLHRGKYAAPSDRPVVAEESTKKKPLWKRMLIPGLTSEFTRGDKIIYGIVVGKTLFTVTYFVIMTILAFSLDYGESEWRTFHMTIFGFFAFTSFIIIIWLSIGGVRDLITMIRLLKSARRDDDDDGWVVQGFAKQTEEEDKS